MNIIEQAIKHMDSNQRGALMKAMIAESVVRYPTFEPTQQLILKHHLAEMLIDCEKEIAESEARIAKFKEMAAFFEQSLMSLQLHDAESEQPLS